ncbi:MAG: hypothetical protein LBJ62_01790 [Bifidobacteriaceae bacterium]|nr:hypothetical protein [Bifidobacteriaceae bacterium]
MRTTLDLDEHVIHMARAKAAAEGTSIGRAVSDLVLSAAQRAPLTLGEDPAGLGLRVVDGPPGHVITDEMVYLYQDDA